MITALIPARGGSKGVKNKNIRNFRDKPLIRHTIDAAIESGIFNQIFVSSDSKEILDLCSDVTCYWRPKHLALDNTPMDAVITDFIDHIEMDGLDQIMLLQPTSPLRTAQEIRMAQKAFTYGDALVSVNKVPSEYLKGYIQIGHYLKPIYDNKSDRRQDLPDFYIPNGAIYLFNKYGFLNNYRIPKTNIVPFLMHSSLDIDTEEDFYG